MSTKTTSKFAITSISTILVSLVTMLPIVNAEEDPFETSNLSSGYVVAEHHGKHGEHHDGHRMKKMDTDGDGTISKEEFMTHKEKCFARKDVDGDGKLTADEMKKRKHGKHEKHHREGKKNKSK